MAIPLENKSTPANLGGDAAQRAVALSVLGAVNPVA